MNTVLIIPTGLGFEIGGHAGDGNPVAKLIGACSDILVTHPNVVNASDINEMPENTYYVEGSTLDRFLRGEIRLKQPKYNRILVATNAPIKNEVVNSVSAARATIGADIQIVELNTPLRMVGAIRDGRAAGTVEGWRELVEQVSGITFDALAITTPIGITDETKRYYFAEGGINPWGGIEAIASKLIAQALNKPVAHSPSAENDPEWKSFNEIVDPRMSAEIVSVSYLHCILKGLHRAPRLSTISGLSVHDIDALVSPIGCWGPPHEACGLMEIPIIAVEENMPVNPISMPSDCIIVDDYLAAAGVLMAMRAGIHWLSVRRPLVDTGVRHGP